MTAQTLGAPSTSCGCSSVLEDESEAPEVGVQACCRPHKTSRECLRRTATDLSHIIGNTTSKSHFRRCPCDGPIATGRMASGAKYLALCYAVGAQVPVFDPMPRLVAFGALLPLGGCTGELTALAALAFGMSLSAWMFGRARARRSLMEAESMRLAIAAGDPRGAEDHLRKELALAAAGEAVSLERQWLARAQLGGLMVAEWRLDEAREIYGNDDEPDSPHLAALAAFGRHELAVLTEEPGEDRLAAIRQDRDSCLHFVPDSFREDVNRAWQALEGLCLIRMGRAREGVALLETGMDALEYNPAQVVYLFHLGMGYEHIGERQLATGRYEAAMNAFPGTRLASEARARLQALGPGAHEGMFRRMLPEPPSAAPSTALVPVAEDDEALETSPTSPARRGLWRRRKS